MANALTLTMEDLKKLPRVELVSVLECAGNGRGLYEPTMAGLQWEYGSVGNARWAGVRLARHVSQVLFYRLVYAGMFLTGIKLVWDGFA